MNKQKLDEIKVKISRSGWGMYDTKTYRYTVKDGNVVRIRLEYLDTTAALDSENWEILGEW